MSDGKYRYELPLPSSGLEEIISKTAWPSPEKEDEKGYPADLEKGLLSTAARFQEETERVISWKEEEQKVSQKMMTAVYCGSALFRKQLASLES